MRLRDPSEAKVALSPNLGDLCGRRAVQGRTSFTRTDADPSRVPANQTTRRPPSWLSQSAKHLQHVIDELLKGDCPGRVQRYRSIFSFSFALISKTQLRAFRSLLLLSVDAVCALDVSTRSGRFYVLWRFYVLSAASACSGRTTCSGRFYVLSMDTLRALDASMFLRLPGVWLSLSLVGAHAGSGWWRQASAIRFGLARRLPRGGHDLISASWSTFTDLFPSMPCLRRFSYLSVTSSLSLSRLGTETRSTEVCG